MKVGDRVQVKWNKQQGIIIEEKSGFRGRNVNAVHIYIVKLDSGRIDEFLQGEIKNVENCL